MKRQLQRQVPNRQESTLRTVTRYMLRTGIAADRHQRLKSKNKLNVLGMAKAHHSLTQSLPEALIGCVWQRSWPWAGMDCAARHVPQSYISN